jgi:hypothetical protein
MGELGFRYAGQTDAKALYHYEKFNADYLTATLREHKIHCSDPANLNDPWDFRPTFNSRSVEDPAKLEQAIEWFHRQGDGSLAPRLVKLYEDRLRNDSNERARFLGGLSRQNIDLIGKRRMYCLTPCPTSILMWSHYAENHRGICLEFGTDNALFRMAVEVIYSKEYPVWAPMDFEEQQHRAMEMLLTKAEDWRYENEFRLISLHNSEIAGPLRVDDGCFTLPPGALKSVIAGCSADYDAVTGVVRACMPDLPVKRAIRVPDHYRLTIEDDASRNFPR